MTLVTWAVTAKPPPRLEHSGGMSRCQTSIFHDPYLRKCCPEAAGGKVLLTEELAVKQRFFVKPHSRFWVRGSNLQCLPSVPSDQPAIDPLGKVKLFVANTGAIRGRALTVTMVTAHQR